jgi:D-serine deaminase-like pyridoxal phosphate-dependent protein
MRKLRKEELDTPALLLDLPLMEHNLKKMADFFRDKPAKLRPHFKNHKVASLALRQFEEGAIGITCATLEEAEVLIRAGVHSILIANEIAGEFKLSFLFDLAAATELIIAVDNEKVASDMARMARNRRTELNVLVDIDVGLKRCGVQPRGPVCELARSIVSKEGLRFRGLMGYEGHLQPIPPGPEKIQLCEAAMCSLVDSKQLIEEVGISVEIVSTGGTGTHSIAGTYPGITEIQAGSYLVMDTLNMVRAPGFTPSLTVLTTVISKRARERVIVDAGSKVISLERGMPVVRDIPGVELKALHAVHGLIDISASAPPIEVGDKIELWAYYNDGTINLHERMYGIRNGEVEEVLPIEGKGKKAAASVAQLRG